MGLRPPGPRPAGPVNAFEACVLLSVALLGITILTGIGSSASITQSLSPKLACIWATLYACGGSVAFVGLVWRNPFTGVELKRVGLVAVFFGGLVYALAAFDLGPRGIPTAILHGGIALAALTRDIQVTRKLRAARRHFEGAGESGA